jgi:hypothetical protein
MKLVFRRGAPSRFRISWLGYDRTEVDAFLARTESDRQRLHEDLAQLAAVMATSGGEKRELERLASIRREVASCLETSIGALRMATGLLGGVAQPPAAQPHPTPLPAAPAKRAQASIGVEHLTASLRFRDEVPHPMPVSESIGGRPLFQDSSRAGSRAIVPPWLIERALPAWTVLRRKPVAAGTALVAVLMFAGFMYQNEPQATALGEAPAQASAPVQPMAPPPTSVPPPAVETPATTAEPAPAAPERVDGLVLTLTARRACWVGTTLDGGQRMEKLLNANETIIVRATNEAILRIGDATALAVLINNQPTRPLGTTGQVVTTRITMANYKGLLAD